MSPGIRRAAWWIACGASLAFVAAATLRPAGVDPFEGWSWCVYCPTGQVKEIVQNLLLFVPFGFALGLRGGGAAIAIAIGAVTSVVVETIQIVIPGRDSNFGDLIFNTTGTALGWLLARATRTVVEAPPDRRARAAFAAAGATITALTLAALLMQPATTHAPYTAHRRPVRSGGILAASLGDAPAEHGPLTPAATVALAARARIVVRTELSAPDVNPSWLRIRDARRREVFDLRKIGSDVVFRYRMRIAQFGLEQPVFHARRALQSYAPGDTVDVALIRDRLRLCALVGSAVQCGFGPTLGRSWTFVERVRALPAALERALDAVWIAVLFLPTGLVVRPERVALAAVGAAAASLWVIPAVAGLEPSTVTEAAGAMAGIAAAAFAARAFGSRRHNTIR